MWPQCGRRGSSSSNNSSSNSFCYVLMTSTTHVLPALFCGWRLCLDTRAWLRFCTFVREISSIGKFPVATSAARDT
jgi:hypothetical protein